MGASGTEAGIAGGQQHPPVRQPQHAEDGLGAAGHAFMFGGAVVGMGDRDQLDFAELVLAQHPAGVAAGRPGLGAVAVGQRGEADRELLFGHDLARNRVGQRHFRGRDQPAAVGGAEVVLGEFRQLAGAEQGGVVDQGRHDGFRVAVLGGVQVQHELAQRPLHARERATQDGEARAGQLGGGGEIHHAQRLAEFEMLLRLEAEVARFAVLSQYEVGGFVGTVGDLSVEDIGQRLQDALDRLVEVRRALFQPFHLAAQRRGLGFQRRGIGTGALALADLARQRVAARLFFLQRGLRRPPVRIARQDVRRHRCQSTPRHGRVERGPIGSDGADIVHRFSPPPVSSRPIPHTGWKFHKARSAAARGRSG